MRKDIKDNLVKVVIPVYSENLTEDEKISLNQCCAILSRYPIVIVKPESLKIDALCEQYPHLQTESFDDKYFRGVESYNALMLSPEFYTRFLDSEYILIYQLDAYVFRDELESWCSKSYDYIGAPWIPRDIFLKRIRAFFSNIFGSRKRFYWDTYYKVGNGGFSLRRTSVFHEITVKEKALIQTYLAPPDKHVRYHPEDIFWSLEPQRRNYHFSIPDYRESLLFSFDKYPRLCFGITKKIPFGCHAWNRKKMFAFWKNYIFSA